MKELFIGFLLVLAAILCGHLVDTDKKISTLQAQVDSIKVVIGQDTLPAIQKDSMP